MDSTACDQTFLPEDGPIVRVVSAYQGTPIIQHEIDEDVTLVLVGHEGMNWTVTESFPGSVQAVYTVTGSGDASTYALPPGVPRTDLDLGWVSDYWDPDARALENRLASFGLTPDSWHSCYELGTVRVFEGATPNPIIPAPPCIGGPRLPPPDVSALPPSCLPVLTESEVCMDGQGTLHGMDTGNSCNIQQVVGGGPSVVWSGDVIYNCAQGSLTQHNLLTGVSTRTRVSCGSSGGVTTNNGHLWVKHAPGFTFDRYPSFEDAQCLFSNQTSDLGRGSRYGSHDGVLYQLWHSTDVIERELFQGGSLPDLPLGFDGWVQGISATDDKIFVIGGISGNRIHGYTHDGVSLFERPYTGASGLHCITP